MTTYLSVGEAASYLGVSKGTLRNWDKSGKLVAQRHPVNGYRVYEMDKLRALKPQESLWLDDESAERQGPEQADLRTVKQVISRIHTVLRDTDGDSSLIARFDELTKLLFLKMGGAKIGVPEDLFDRWPSETQDTYASRIRDAYAKACDAVGDVVPAKQRRLALSKAAISEAGDVLSAITFSDAKFDIKGVAYEELIRGTFDKGENQQFFTPPQVVEFMVSMLKPYLRGSVADPACGTGGFLAEIVRRDLPYDHLYAFEVDQRLTWVTGINLLLHGARSYTATHLKHSGTLGPAAKPYLGAIDVIVTNPPFGSDLTNRKLLDGYELGKGRQARRRGILFVERCYELLAKNGILAIVIDEGVLNLPSARDVREFIIDRFNILSIVSLPESAFLPYASVNASILILEKKTTSNQRVQTFFAKAEKVGRKSNGDDDIVYDDAGGSSSNSDLPKIEELWLQGPSNNEPQKDNFGFWANIYETIEGNDRLRLDYRYHHPSRLMSEQLLKESEYPVSPLTDLCDERNETFIPYKESSDPQILYTGLANIESHSGVARQESVPAASLKSSVKRYEPGDIVFARMRPNLRKVALMGFPAGGYVSPECVVLVPRTDSQGVPLIDPNILAPILRSDLVFGQIMHLVAGIGRPRLNVSDLRSVRIPVPPSGAQDQFRSKYEMRCDSARRLRERAEELRTEAARVESDSIRELCRSIIDGSPGADNGD